MPKFEIGEICLLVQTKRGPITPRECQIISIRPGKFLLYTVQVPGKPSKHSSRNWACRESWLRKKPRSGADIVKDMIKNAPISLISNLEKENEKCTSKITR